MTTTSVFDLKLPLPNRQLTARAANLLGFTARYDKVEAQLRLMLQADKLDAWSKKHHRGKLTICDLVADQYPFVIFHGDVGTGKTANAEGIANRLAADSHVEDCMLFKLSNRVRGSGKVGEMGSLLAEAFQEISQAIGKTRRAVLIIDEGDSLAASRTQDQSHHEDKVAVNTLIQSIDDLRRFGGRILVFLCTNRLSVLDPALRRRAAVVEEFLRPDDRQRRELLTMDLGGLDISARQVDELVAATGPVGKAPCWTYSDIRTRLYPAALAVAFPDRALKFEDLLATAKATKASPVMEDR